MRLIYIFEYDGGILMWIRGVAAAISAYDKHMPPTEILLLRTGQLMRPNTLIRHRNFGRLEPNIVTPCK